MSYCPVPNGQSVHPKLLSELQHANIMDTAVVQAVGGKAKKAKVRPAPHDHSMVKQDIFVGKADE